MEMDRKKGGRPRIENRSELRSKRVSFALTPGELTLLKARVRKSGKDKAEYCREAVLKGAISPVLGDEDRYILLNLHKLGIRVNQLFIQGGLKRDVRAKEEYEAFVAEFKRIKDYFNEKTERK